MPGNTHKHASQVWLSILLPVYNVESYLAACIHSIVQQSGCDNSVEIIIVDDCSTDDSRCMAERLCVQFPQQLRLVCHDNNKGVSAARNRLLDEARGEFIWFIDPDDLMLGEALADLRAVVARCNPDLVLCDYRKSKLWRRRSFFGPKNCLSSDIKQLVQGVFRSRKMYCWVKISRRSLWLNGLRFPEGRVFEDVATTPWLLLKVKSYYYVPKAWIYYRKRTGSIMDSVRRRPGHFDEAKHEDLAQALIGYPRDLENCFGQLEPALAYPVADFCAKEFTKTASRIMRSKNRKEGCGPMSNPQTRFQSLWQLSSPIPFEQLTSYYLKRLRFIRYGILRYFI